MDFIILFMYLAAFGYGFGLLLHVIMGLIELTCWLISKWRFRRLR